MFEEKAQSYRVKDKEIYRVKLACQNTKVYRVNTQLTKGTITLLYFFCFFLHMRTLSVLDKYRANVLGPCRARVITLFTVFPWRVTFKCLNLRHVLYHTELKGTLSRVDMRSSISAIAFGTCFFRSPNATLETLEMSSISLQEKTEQLDNVK